METAFFETDLRLSLHNQQEQQLPDVQMPGVSLLTKMLDSGRLPPNSPQQE
jgi:hypothetical protein